MPEGAACADGYRCAGEPVKAGAEALGTQAPTCHIACAAPGGFGNLTLGEGDLLIAADGGYATCLEQGLQPDLLVGDFDSLPGGKPGQPACPCVELPQAKDETDFMVALRAGLERGYRRFACHAILGGDVGHTLGALHSLMWLREQGAWGVLQGGGQAAVLVRPEDGVVSLASLGVPLQSVRDGVLASGTRVSVFSFGGVARGVTERGLVWELEGAVMQPGDHYGVSNAVACANPTVSVGEGTLLVVVG